MDQNQNSTEKAFSIVNIEDEMRGAYLDYAMSVIVGRALPDVRDGLKPVHRRVLFAMYDLSNSYNRAYKKSARVVGDVIGKYHPHGDMAVYDTMVRMSQDFSLRYPLIDGQGNFGSIDGDNPAAMRYTEVRMAKITDEMLADLDKETVDFGTNYDESLKEPLVLPSRLPNLIVNGTSGIAVGMATNIPPHNLSEVSDALVHLIQNPQATIEELMVYIKGPDFPTGGFICGLEGIRSAYRTGRGVIQMRAKVKIEASKKGDRESIIVEELPYQVNKARLIEKIAELVRDKRLEGISDLRDESDRTGMRIFIELKRGENSQVILNRLYKLTQMQDSFGINMLALHYGQPKVFNLKEILQAFITHRREIVVRRTIFDLKKAEARAHILEGLVKALDHLDAVIQLIRAATSPDAAREGLVSNFQFSEIQAQAILEMRLQRLTGLERDKITAEYKDVLNLIAKLREVLGSESLVFEIILKEIKEIKDEFGDERRTQLMPGEAESLDMEDLIADEEVVVSLTHTGYVKRMAPSTYRSQRRGGKGVRGVATSDEDFVSKLFMTTTLSYLLCFTNKGRLFWLKVYKIPEASKQAKGKAIVNLVNLQPDEKIRAILPVKAFREDAFIVMVTKKGIIKKTDLTAFSNPRPSGLIALSIDDEDELVAAKLSNGKDHVFLASHGGMSIRFPEDDVRPMGRNARGVKGMDLDDGDYIVSMEVISPELKEMGILTVAENGYGKRTELDEYRVQSRGGKGLITMKMGDRNGAVMGTMAVTDKDDLMIITDKGQVIRIKLREIRSMGRNTQGVRLISIGGLEKVVSIEQLAENDEQIESLESAESAPAAGVTPQEEG